MTRSASSGLVSAASYKLPPMCVAVSVEALRDWAALAVTGAEIVYAQGQVLDRRHEAALLARTLAEDGRVVLFQRRCPGGFEYLARKLPPRAAPVAPSTMPDEDTPLGACLAILRRAADAGQDCPSHGAIARALGLKNAEAARYQMRKLEDLGHIRVTREADVRSVTIMSSGRVTRSVVAGGRL